MIRSPLAVYLCSPRSFFFARAATLFIRFPWGNTSPLKGTNLNCLGGVLKFLRGFNLGPNKVKGSRHPCMNYPLAVGFCPFFRVSEKRQPLRGFLTFARYRSAKHKHILRKNFFHLDNPRKDRMPLKI